MFLLQLFGVPRQVIPLGNTKVPCPSIVSIQLIGVIYLRKCSLSHVVDLSNQDVMFTHGIAMCTRVSYSSTFYTVRNTYFIDTAPRNHVITDVDATTIFEECTITGQQAQIYADGLKRLQINNTQFIDIETTNAVDVDHDDFVDIYNSTFSGMSCTTTACLLCGGNCCTYLSLNIQQ